MYIIPDSKVILIKNPLKLDNNNEIMFSNAQAQETYFKSLPKLEFNNLTYQRKDGTLRIETNDNLTFEDLLGYNFCMYQNTHFDDKWFYAFITDVTWVNSSVTELKLETAYYQTWQFNLRFMDSFIEREHVDNDTLGLHTMNENLETGEYICDTSTNIYSANDTYICVGVSEIAEGIQLNPYVSEYNGVYSGIKYFLCENTLAASNLIRGYDSAGKGDSVNNIFLIPKNFFTTQPTFTTTTIAGITTQIAVVPYSQVADVLATSGTFTPSNSFGNYTPKNRKCYTFPYCYLYLTNNIGSDCIYHYEDFINNQAQFKVVGAITPSCSIKCVPLNYKKLSDTNSSLNSFSYGIMGAKTPMCSWVNDPYTNWLTQNGINIGGSTFNQQEASTLAGVGSILVGSVMLATGVGGAAGAGLIGGGALGIFNSMKTNYQKDLIPQQAKGSVNGGDVQYSAGCSTIQAYKMCVREEMIRSIDSYFSMFGYLVNRLGKPHLHARTYYDFIKTIDVNIEGDLPEKDLNEIKKMFNNGIRFWHNTDYYLDFSVNNTIL